MTARKPTDVRRTEIADAALNVVATRGIAALTTRVLADAVGLTTGALFKHFASRDALFLGMAERVSDLLHATYPDEALPPRERLVRLAHSRLSLVSDSAGVLTLSWPAGEGWRLEQQTNALSTGISTNWVDVTPGSTSTTNITVDNTKPTVFYRLTYP